MTLYPRFIEPVLWRAMAGTPADNRGLDGAYRAAVYTVEHPEGRFSFTFERSEGDSASELAIDRLPFRQPWAIVTGANPGSTRLPEEENRRRHAELVELVRRSGYTHHPSRGRDRESGDWDERGLAIEGMARWEVLDLARRFGQRAAVLAEAGRIGLLHAADGRFEPLDAYRV